MAGGTENNSMSKIFGIGLSRTGTKSLAAALRILGYNAVHFPPLTQLYELVDSHDAATDTTVACRYKELDRRYPDSKFILTVRDESSWLISAERHFKRAAVFAPWVAEVRTSLYGAVEWDHGTFRTAFRTHNEEVVSYFRASPERLLIMDIAGGDGWPHLCRFLNRPLPSERFPWVKG